MDNDILKVSHIDREIDSVISHFDSEIEQCTGNQNPLDSTIATSREYLEDLEDGVQDKSTEHYQDQAMKNAVQALPLGTIVTELLSDAEGDQWKDLVQNAVEQVVSEPPPARLSKPDLILAAQYYIKRDNKQRGPVSGDTILKNFRDGRLKTSDEISESGEGPWIEMKDSELLSLF
jgi:hypothetical protein